MSEAIFLYPEIGGMYESLQQISEHVCHDKGIRCINTCSLDEVRTRIMGGAPIDRVVIVMGGKNISVEDAKKILSHEYPEINIVTIQGPHWKNSADETINSSAMDSFIKALERPSNMIPHQD